MSRMPLLRALPALMLLLLLSSSSSGVSAGHSCSDADQSDSLACVLRGFPAQGNFSADTGNNPYGMLVIPKTTGRFRKGDLLVSNWNDVNNTNFGQGNLITQLRDRRVVRTIAIGREQLGVCAVDGVVGTGLGFTMAFVYIGRGKVLQCSTPINFDASLAPNNANGTVFPPFPGCCLVIDDRGRVLATFRANGINGPWGAASFVEFDDERHEDTVATVFLASVLGTDHVLDTNNGQVTRYHFVVPKNDADWVSGPDDAHTGSLGPAVLIASGFASVPALISTGFVGPSGLALLPPFALELVIADTEGAGVEGATGPGTLQKIQRPLHCNSGPGDVTCTLELFASCGTNACLNPIGINWTPTPSSRSHESASGADRSSLNFKWLSDLFFAHELAEVQFGLLVANAGDGHLVQYDEKGRETCFIIGDAAGAGTLFNILTVPVAVRRERHHHCCGEEEHRCGQDDDDEEEQQEDECSPTQLLQVAYVDDGMNNVLFQSAFTVQS